MGLLETLMSSGTTSGGIQQLARQFGLSEEQTQSAVASLMPALAGGLQNSASSEDGRQGVLTALTGGAHQQFADDPAALATPAAIDAGNGILGQLLGSREASRAVAAQASENTGLSADLLKKMLPMVAAMAMGGLSKQAAETGASQEGGMMGMLSSFLDQNKDGSIADDMMGMASKFFNK